MAAAEGRVLGEYVLRARIGGGGMSEVFAAEHRERGDAVAVKVLRPHLAADEAQAARFVAEAARTRAIAHGNVVRVLDGGRADDGTLYLVMERIDGEDLAARLARVGRLDEGEVRRIGAAVADGMQAAHERGVIHRDLKPANILLGADGEPRIVDFGIAKLLGGEPGATGPTMGTPHYIAPEQLTDGAVAPSVDVWALGVTLFEAATGTLPFVGYSEGRCPQLVDAAPRPGERVAMSTALEALILQCLKRNPAQRPATMREVAERLRSDEAALDRSTAPLAPPPRVGAAASLPSPRRRWLVRAAAASIGIVLVGGAAWWLELRHAPAATVMAAPVAAPSPPPTPPMPIATPTVHPDAPPTPAHATPTHTTRATHTHTRHHAAHHARSPIYGEKLD